MDEVRVLIVDDHPLARRGIESILSEDPIFKVVGCAADGFEAVQKARELKPDVILMDINLPGQDGLAATRAIKEEMPHVRVVIVTVSDDAQDLFEALRAGAQGYLLKNLSSQEWTEYLHAVVRGEARISKKIARRILREFKVASSEETSLPDELSPRECEILRCVAKGASNKEIADELFISENTVKNHLKNILAKLHLKNRVQLATYAIKQGLGPE